MLIQRDGRSVSGLRLKDALARLEFIMSRHLKDTDPAYVPITSEDYEVVGDALSYIEALERRNGL